MTHEEQFPNCPFCYANKKETAVIDDSNCHCMKCSTNSDIQKEFGVANDDKLRISIYREAWQDAEKETIKLREENEKLKQRNTEQNDWLVRLQEENKKLRKEKETLVNDRASLVGEANELYEAIGRISGIVNEIID